MTLGPIGQNPVASKDFKILAFMREEIQARQNNGKKPLFLTAIRP
jgi:hypothetical protein